MAKILSFRFSQNLDILLTKLYLEAILVFAEAIKSISL